MNSQHQQPQTHVMDSHEQSQTSVMNGQYQQ